MFYTYKGQLSTDKDNRKLCHILGHTLIPVWPIIQPKQEMELWKNTQVVKLICQLIADLRRGMTCNSKLIRSFMSCLFGGQLPTDKLRLQFVYIFIVNFLFWLELFPTSFYAWAGSDLNSSPKRIWNYENLHKW